MTPQHNGFRRWSFQLFLALYSVTAANIESQAFAEDWPQWRGPQRNGISPESGGLAGWPEGTNPRVAWRASVGKGHSAVSIADGRAYTLGWDGERDHVYCFAADPGNLLWEQSYPCKTILQWPGPRATPTVSQGIVYTLGQHGQLRAWNAQTGEPIWGRDLPEIYNPDVDYGFAWSPLLQEDLVILNAGSHGLAIKARDGTIAWGDDGKKGACVSAVPYTYQGRRGVLCVSLRDDRSAAILVGVDPLNGDEQWRFDGWLEQWGAMGVDPLVQDGKIFITSAEQYRQAARFSIDGQTLRMDWTTNRVAGYTGGAIWLNEHVYLVDGNGVLKCLDWETGDTRWSQRGFDERGTLIAAGDVLLIQTGSSGQIVIVAAEPAGYRELRRMTVFADEAHTFTAPVMANGRIYCRSYAGEVVCVDLNAVSE